MTTLIPTTTKTCRATLVSLRSQDAHYIHQIVQEAYWVQATVLKRNKDEFDAVFSQRIFLTDNAD